jgi:hypothetical protein
MTVVDRLITVFDEVGATGRAAGRGAARPPALPPDRPARTTEESTKLGGTV